MAVTTTDSTLDVTKWRRDFWREYQRENLFAAYMGADPSAVIHRVYELKQGGEHIVLPLVGRLKGSGVSGSATLAGNEESMDEYGHKVNLDWARHAVILNKKEMNKSAIDQLKVVRPALMDWATAKIRDDIIKALFNVGTVSITGNVNGVQYGSASSGQKNTWSDANKDRVLYGNSTNNYVAGNHASSLANIDATNDIFSAANAKLLKAMAKKADPHIRPLRVETGREYFIAFAGSNAFRDFSNDSTVIQANTGARAREGAGMNKNPLFQDGDLLLNGIIVREVPEIDTLTTITGVGASSINVAPVFLCGQQAVAYAVGQLPAPTERKEDDYGFLKGRGVETAYGVAKVQKQLPNTSTLIDWGVATGFFASVNS